MSKQELNHKIRKNIKELKTIIDLMESNQSREKNRYFSHLARIYLYETSILINSDIVPSSVKTRAINDLTNLASLINPHMRLNVRT